MADILGIDTSNYTTSCAVLNTETMKVVNFKKLLPVKEGALGLRQSDAVFHHVKQLPELLNFENLKDFDIKGIGVSVKPRMIDGSYMPCFLVGETVAESISSVKKIDVEKTSHQVGHVLAALYSSNKLDLLKNEEGFIAFHVSGGTTDCLYVKPDCENVIKIEEVGTSLDLKAGQAVDRVGLMLGLKFPCGPELEKLALKSNYQCKISPSLRGCNCSLSGVENKCREMLESGVPYEDIALFCITYIEETLVGMTKRVFSKFGKLPVVFAGGVMSNTIIRESLSEKFNGYFAAPEFSCDNASGTAIFYALKKGLI